jgi:GDPmannose 4,6-dehydratase
MVKMAFGELGIELDFIGEGKNEKGIVKSCSNKNFVLEQGKEVVSIDPHYFRPTEVDLLIGDASKAKNKLGWTPEYSLEELIKEMMEHDVNIIQKELYLKKGGHAINMNYE